MSSWNSSSGNGSPKPFGAPSPERVPPASPSELETGIERTRDFLLTQQHPDGHWCGELEGDTILESEYVLLQTFLGRLGDSRIIKCARYIESLQCEDGGWANYPGGPSDISVSVKAYFALKIAGYSPNSEIMRKARFAILEMGGAENVNSFTRFYLAALGQIPYSHCPSVPPELVLLPHWFPVSLYRMSSWTRTIVVPLSIFYSYQPVAELPEDMGIAELFRTPPTADTLPPAAQMQGRMLGWPNIFRMIDRGLKFYHRFAPRFLRRRAIAAAEEWMIERFAGSDGLGAIFPPMVYTIIALKCLGYAEDSHEMKWAEKHLDDLIIEEGDTIRLQPCVSPVWDTGWAMLALKEAGVPDNNPAMRRAADWLLEREIREPGDWAISATKEVEPSGWAFEYNNKFYPDIDDTALILMALQCSQQYEEPACQQAIHRGICWLLEMQNRDRGWAAFDKHIDNEVLEAIPFADHNAMLDPSCPDITARILELFGKLGYRRGKPFIDDAIRFLFDNQEPEGCWFGRWGVNYIYGTWQTLMGLSSIGYDMRHPRVQKAVDWLLSVQQANGGWGESCAAYDDRNLMGQGPTTASQTAWAVMALIAAGHADCDAVHRGAQYLLRTQKTDGTWDEPWFTGTGFPRVFYLKYHYYRIYFPLLALAHYRASLPKSEPQEVPASITPTPTPPPSVDHWEANGETAETVAAFHSRNGAES